MQTPEERIDALCEKLNSKISTLYEEVLDEIESADTRLEQDLRASVSSSYRSRLAEAIARYCENND